ncbi:MAG: hypothetical protein HQL23_05980 [Candidatus Omnitrophica bacterium]|nr:hypothetical protein [Candidatus Omnitrophota bacterium]
MPELKLAEGLRMHIQAFVADLQQLYQDDLVAVSLYGSAASGELSPAHSNVNILVVLRNTDIATLEKARKITLGLTKRRIEPLFLSQPAMLDSCDVFPIEFMDMRENHICLHGPDVLAELKIDLKHLRFQCEQELRSKSILLKQQYLRIDSRDRKILAKLLFQSLTSVGHLLRNLLRLKGQGPVYAKEEVFRQAAADFKVDSGVFLKILAAKQSAAPLKADVLRALFADYVRELDKIIESVDKL